MFDDILTLAVHHYVIAGILVLAIGVMLNVVVAAAPELVESLRMHKLF